MTAGVVALSSRWVESRGSHHARLAHHYRQCTGDEVSATDPGPRDHLITRALTRALEDLDPDVLVEIALDAAEAPERLARHAMDEIRRQLDDDESADRQVERVNHVLRDLAGDGYNEREVVQPPRVLQGIKGRSQLGQLLPLAPLPATPAARATCSSTLKVNRTLAPSFEPSSRQRTRHLTSSGPAQRLPTPPKTQRAPDSTGALHENLCRPDSPDRPGSGRQSALTSSRSCPACRRRHPGRWAQAAQQRLPRWSGCSWRSTRRSEAPSA